MTIRRLRQRTFVNARVAALPHFTGVRNEQPLNALNAGGMQSVRKVKVRLPPRPDASALSEAIPLFYIARNRDGFWVVWEAESRNGGVFLLQRSALRFARKSSGRAACATMLLGEPFELDGENQGSRLVAPVAAVLHVARRRVPVVVACIAAMAAEWRTLMVLLSRTFTDHRRSGDVTGKDFLQGQYAVTSKNDDGLLFHDQTRARHASAQSIRSFNR